MFINKAALRTDMMRRVILQTQLNMYQTGRQEMFYQKSVIGMAAAIVCIFFLSITCQAGDAQIRSQSKRKVDTTPRTPSRQQETNHQYAPAGGGTKSLCCGSVDAQNMTGVNCAFLPKANNCAGQILSCPPNQPEWIDPDNGDGGCG